MLRFLVCLSLLTACKKSPAEAPPAPVPPVPVVPAPPAPPPPPAPAPVAAPEGAPGMIRALSVRDPEPVCADVEAMSPTPVEALSYVVSHVSMPPQAPMRAAGCLVAHGDAVRDDLLTWVDDPAKQGLGRLLLQRLADLPEPLAAEVVSHASSGELAEVAREAAAADARPAVMQAVAP